MLIKKGIPFKYIDEITDPHRRYLIVTEQYCLFTYSYLLKQYPECVTGSDFNGVFDPYLDYLKSFRRSKAADSRSAFRSNSTVVDI